MSNEEIKHLISKVLDYFSDQVMQELLTFLKDLDARQSELAKMNPTLTKILLQDKELLIQLAQ